MGSRMRCPVCGGSLERLYYKNEDVGVMKTLYVYCPIGDRVYVRTWEGLKPLVEVEKQPFKDPRVLRGSS